MNRTLSLLLVSLLSSLASAQTVISTIAGSSTGASGFSGDGGQATAAKLNQPSGIAVDSSGNIYIADTNNFRVRMISPSGVITTVAGNGTQGFSGDGGPATAASLTQPLGITVDSSGNLYIADFGGSVIRKVSNGIISTIAGKYGLCQEYGDTGLATSAVLCEPSGVAVDTSGNVFIADTDDNVIRKITASTGDISVVAGYGTAAGFAGDGGSATAAAVLLNSPTDVFVDASGNLYIADSGNNRIRKVSNGNITTIAGNGQEGSSNDSGGSATAAELYKPFSLAVDASGNVYITNTQTNRLVEVSGGNISTLTGNGIPGTYDGGGSPALAELNQPKGVAVDASGNIYIADTVNNRIQEISATFPAIKPSGIVPVDSTVSTVQPGEWIAIYGSNLGPATPVNWNGNFPLSLGGTSVTIDGTPAYLYYVSAGQINVQVPDDQVATPRSVPVVVTVGSQSVTSSVNLASVAPSFALLADNLHVAGIILRTDGSGAYGNGTYDIIGPTINTLGYKTVPAKAGDNIELFGFGFGPTTPAVPAGQVFPPTLTSGAPTTNTVTLTIGNTPVVTSFTGLSEAGTYQFNLTVPTGIGTGDVSIAASVTGVSTATGEPSAVISLQ